jgi:Flp pilus assembly pilin Flp
VTATRYIAPRTHLGEANSPCASAEGVNSIRTIANRFRQRASIEAGQTMAEYGVVLAVITLGVVVALTALSGGITGALNSVVSQL